MSDRLVFVYNADGGLMNGIMDSVHKTLSPATYACGLCAITHGALRMNATWRAWLKALPMPAAFYHRDDSPYAGLALPAVLRDRDGAIEVLIAADEFAAFDSVDALIATLEGRLG